MREIQAIAATAFYCALVVAFLMTFALLIPVVAGVLP